MIEHREGSLKCTEIHFFPHLNYFLSPHLHKLFLVKQYANACDLIAGICVVEVNLDLKLRHY